MPTKCPVCGASQWSPMDKQYVSLFGHCWSQDKKAWEDGDLTLEEFERREEEALASTNI